MSPRRPSASPHRAGYGAPRPSRARPKLRRPRPWIFRQKPLPWGKSALALVVGAPARRPSNGPRGAGGPRAAARAAGERVRG
jgi:hypothetical protein